MMKLLAVMLAIGAMGLPAGQNPVGPAAPQPDEPFAARARALHPLLSGLNAGKVWATNDDATLKELFEDLVDAKKQIEGMSVGPVAPRPTPATPPPGPKPKPTKKELQDATLALRRTLDKVAKTQPTLELPDTESERLDRITDAFNSPQ